MTDKLRADLESLKIERAEQAPRRRSKRLGRWVLLAVLVVVVGFGASSLLPSRPIGVEAAPAVKPAGGQGTRVAGLPGSGHVVSADR